MYHFKIKGGIFVYLVDQNNVVVYDNKKQKKDIAFPRAELFPNAGVFGGYCGEIRELRGEDAIASLLSDFCSEYLFAGTNISYFDNPKIAKLITNTYPSDYKGIRGVAWWEEEGYADNLARIRLYRKLRKMTRRFAKEVYDFLKKRQQETLDNASEKKLRVIREFYFNKIHYEVDTENKVVRAFFGKDISEARDNFARLAIYVLNASFLKYNNDIYCEPVEFLPEHFASRSFVGVAKYNQKEETEPFSVEKGKEIAREKLIKKYLRFEYVVGRHNFRKYLDDMAKVQERLEKFLTEKTE